MVEKLNNRVPMNPNPYPYQTVGYPGYQEVYNPQYQNPYPPPTYHPYPQMPPYGPYQQPYMQPPPDYRYPYQYNPNPNMQNMQNQKQVIPERKASDSNILKSTVNTNEPKGQEMLFMY